jgi:hypothetical protein
MPDTLLTTGNQRAKKIALKKIAIIAKTRDLRVMPERRGRSKGTLSGKAVALPTLCFQIILLALSSVYRLDERLAST